MIQDNVKVLRNLENAPEHENVPDASELMKSLHMPTITKGMEELINDADARRGDFADLSASYQYSEILECFRAGFGMRLTEEYREPDVQKCINFIHRAHENEGFDEEASAYDIYHAYRVFLQEASLALVRLLVAAKKSKSRHGLYLSRVKGIEASTGWSFDTTTTDEEAYLNMVADKVLGGEDKGLETKSMRQLVIPVMMTRMMEKVKGKSPAEVALLVAGMVHEKYRKFFVKSTEACHRYVGKAKGYVKRHGQDGLAPEHYSVEDEEQEDDEFERADVRPEMSSRASLSASASDSAFSSKPRLVSMRYD